MNSFVTLNKFGENVEYIGFLYMPISNFHKFCVHAAALPFLLASVPLRSAPPEKIDVGQFPAALLQDVVVPVPSEIFGVLDKLGQPDWPSFFWEGAVEKPSDRAQVALLLGAVIANGFIAVQAEDAERVKEIGREVLDLSAALGVRESVISRSNRIIDAADGRDWMKVRRELDGAMQDVRRAMVELRDEQLAQLVSLGGWLRGTEVLTRVVQNDYSPDTAELLHQPGLLEYFKGRIESMPDNLRTNPLVSSVRDGLGEIQPLVSVGDGRKISLESVDRIHALTTELVGRIKPGKA